jgi:hypothetical protein
MAIDWSAVNWLYVAIMAVFAFVATDLISQPHRGRIPRRHPVRRDVCCLELLPASANRAADRQRLFHAVRRLTFSPLSLWLRAEGITVASL